MLDTIFACESGQQWLTTQYHRLFFVSIYINETKKRFPLLVYCVVNSPLIGCIICTERQYCGQGYLPENCFLIHSETSLSERHLSNIIHKTHI